MINITVQRKEINFTVLQPKPVSITIGGKPISFTVANRGVTYVTSGLRSPYAHSLSQIDIDNKYITVNELISVLDKSSVLVFLENSGFKFEYGVDYTINIYNQIIWNGYNLDGKLMVGDFIKVYY